MDSLLFENGTQSRAAYQPFSDSKVPTGISKQRRERPVVMGSTERRIACLRIAAAQLKRFDKDERPTSADDLINYADELSGWAYRGERTTERGNG